MPNVLPFKGTSGGEAQYLTIEKLAQKIVSAAHHLHPYFQAHIITMPKNYLLLHILRNPDVSNQLTKWALELYEFDIKFVLAKAIKCQALADFVVEPTPKIDEVLEGMWTIFIDRSAIQIGSRVGISLISPTDQRIEHVVHFNFATSKNRVEYKAFLPRIRIAYTIA